MVRLTAGVRSSSDVTCTAAYGVLQQELFSDSSTAVLIAHTEDVAPSAGDEREGPFMSWHIIRSPSQILPTVHSGLAHPATERTERQNVDLRKRFPAPK